MGKNCYRKEYIVCFGKPIDENPTVVAMDAAFGKMGLDYLYNGALVEPEDLGDAVRAIRALHMLGANVTVPHKVAVIPFLDELEPAAALIGAVNTIFWRDGKLTGTNTDGKGFVSALRGAGIGFEGKQIVLLGAGGAARAVAVELALAGAGSLTLVNRTPEKAETIAQIVRGHTAVSAQAQGWEKTLSVPEGTDLLVNCTSIGLWPDESAPDVDFATLRPGTTVCDVIPNPPQTRFLRQAAARGCRTLDGLSMLANQAAVNIRYWTGREAPVADMRAALAKAFAG